MKFPEIIDYKCGYQHFADPPDFHTVLLMIHRKRILQQSGIFLKQNPGEAVISKMSRHRYAANIGGTNAQWIGIK